MREGFMGQRPDFRFVLSLCMSLRLLTGNSLAKDLVPDSVVPATLGIAAHYNSRAYNPAYTDKTFNALKQGHFSLVRFLPDWQHIEKTRGIYDFSTVDWLVNSFRTRGLRPVLCLGLNNALYGVNTRIHNDAQREAFGRFVRALATHYQGQQVIWEVWNEPNIPSFWRVPPTEPPLSTTKRVSEYLALLDAVLPIIRKSDPNALVIGPGAANYNTPWLKEALSQGLLDRLDGLSVHPFQFKQRPELVITQHRQVQSWIPKHCRNKPVFFTEWGYSTGIGPREVTEEIQAAYTQRQYMLSLLLGIRGNFIYSFTDASTTTPCQSPDGCYGLFAKSTGASKPAYHALRAITEPLLGYQLSRRIMQIDPTVYLLEFKNTTGQVKYALWRSRNNQPVQVTLPNRQSVMATHHVQIYEDTISVR